MFKFIYFEVFCADFCECYEPYQYRYIKEVTAESMKEALEKLCLEDEIPNIENDDALWIGCDSYLESYGYAVFKITENCKEYEKYKVFTDYDNEIKPIEHFGY